MAIPALGIQIVSTGQRKHRTSVRFGVGYGLVVPRKPPGPDTRLTPGDIATFNHISGYIRVFGQPPSLRQVAKARGHKTHGPTQRSVNALLATGKLQRLKDGTLQVPGLVPFGISMAQLLGAPHLDWVIAPETHLVAWRLDADFEEFHAGDLVFARRGQADKGELVLAYAEQREKNPSGYAKLIAVYSLHRIVGVVEGNHDGYHTDRPQRGRAVRFIGPVRYVQHEIPPKPAQ